MNAAFAQRRHYRRTIFNGHSNFLLAVIIAAVLCGSSTFAADEAKTAKTSDSSAEKTVAAKQNSQPRLDPRDVYRRLLKSTAWLRFVVEDEGSYEGTGWVVDAEKGLLITNEHVVAGVDELEVYFPVKRDGKTVHEESYYLDEVEPLVGRVIDRDTKLDLALVKVDSLPEGILALPLAAASPEPGERVFTLGSQPRGSEGMWIFTSGEVRQVYRRSHARGHVARIVETQLPTNPGNSGGAVTNDRAEVVAVVEGHSTVARLVSLFVDISELRDYLDTVLPLANPQTADDFNTRGTRRHDAERYDRAIEDYTRSLRMEPDKPVVLTNRGWAFYAKDDYDAALADFEEALAIDPHFGSAFEGRGTTYREMGDYQRAIKDLTNAIRHDPNDASVYQRRGTAYELDGQYKKALADRDKAIELDPEHFDYHYQRGQTLRHLRRYDDALESYEKAASLQPGNAAVCYEIGYVYQDQKQYPQAVFFYTLAIKRDDSVASFFNNRGLCYVEMEEYVDAADDFIKAIELRPGRASYYRRLGIVFHEAGRSETALKHFNKAVELDPDDADNFYWRAKCHDALGNQQSAAADREKYNQLQDE